jgi:myo-inositol 2-dehydrogenase/D-chiro-inositol 1-dehydrogenase
LKIGVALQDSLKSGKTIRFDKDGKQVDEDGQVRARL